jgi:PAS domain S-box-containing protein
MRILLIEDNPGDTRPIRKMLSDADGHPAELECEETLAAGLKRLRNEPFDILLLDLTLPDSRGLETLQKARPFERSFPVVVLTGLEDNGTALKALESGAQDYLVKGKITADSLNRSIRYALLSHAAEEDLRKSETRYDRLFEGVHDSLSSDGALLESEKRFRELFHKNPILVFAEDFSEVKSFIEGIKVAGVKNLGAYFDENLAELAKCASLVKIVDVNDSNLRVYGAKDKEELLAGLPALFTEESLNVFKGEVVALAEGRLRFEAEAVTMTLRGNTRNILIRLSLDKACAENWSSVLVSILDITSEKQVEREFLKSEARYRTLFESSRDALMTLAPSSWRFTSCNTAALEMFGARDESEFISVGLWNLSPGFQPDGRASAEKSREMIDAVIRDGSFLFDWTYRRLGGEEFPATVLLNRMEIGGEIVVQATVRDVTEGKAAEEALRVSEAALEHQGRELRDMLTIASHELRHPAAIFKGYSHILLNHADDLDPVVARDALLSIVSASDRLARTVDQLTYASRIEGGKMWFRFEELEPRALLEGIKERFKDTGADIVTSIGTGDGLMFKADGEKLRAVLENLVENAIKFSPDGSPIGVCVEPVSGGLLFSVCDKGPGIPEENALLVFERFNQVEEVAHHSIPGTGLGLYIAKTIVDEHGGWIRYRPGGGGGSVFEFFIPEHLLTEECLETEQEHVEAELPPSCELRPPGRTLGDAGLNDSDTKRVLRVAVIDDNPEIVKVSMMVLKSRGYEAIGAHSGEEGLEMAARETPDVVLLDIMMPGMDGIETCRRLKSDERTRDIPVIFVTAKTSEECYEEGLSAGGSAFLYKPYKPNELFENIEKVCGAVRTGHFWPSTPGGNWVESMRILTDEDEKDTATELSMLLESKLKESERKTLVASSSSCLCIHHRQLELHGMQESAYSRKCITCRQR